MFTTITTEDDQKEILFISGSVVDIYIVINSDHT